MRDERPSPTRLLLLSIMITSILLLVGVECMDKGKFKKCAEINFCKRQKEYTGSEASSARSINVNTLKADAQTGTLLGEIVEEEDPSNPLSFAVKSHKMGIMQLTVDENEKHEQRYRVKDSVLPQVRPTKWTSEEISDEKISIKNGVSTLTINNKGFGAQLSVNGHNVITFNENNLFSFETQAKRQGKDDWEEYKKPETAIGCDVNFPNADHVYGIPERTTKLALDITDKNSEPYRMYNLDVFEYELDHPMGLYGVVPLVIAHSPEHTSAVLWLNSAETYLDVSRSGSGLLSMFGSQNPGITTHWFSESGVMDVFFLPGPTPHDVMKQYAYLTGTTPLPQMFSLGYHQCRWNYRDETDVLDVDSKFDEHDIPYDVIWLDIEHTDNKKYFTWNSQLFPDSKRLQGTIASKGRKMVTITDPHIKRDSGYYVHNEATQNGYYVKRSDGTVDYEGWCWPGSSSWVDFLNPKAREWYSKLFSYDKYEGSSPSLYTWIDMNEPSVFSGPEVTMDKDALHHGGVQHRHVHNAYGFYHSMAAHAGHLHRNQNRDRPFILTRSFFAGSQRYAAVWTGDNTASWDHYHKATAMLLSLSLSGIQFVGADVGGFFRHPTSELMIRWYQAAAYHPFFRGHAHIDSPRREPWLFGDEATQLIRAAIIARYQILPYLYTQFYHASISGVPIMRPLWMEYPKDKSTYTIDNQFLLGDALLVRPITNQGENDVSVYFPGNESWFDFVNGFKIGSTPRSVTVKSPLDKIPVFQRAGSIIPKKDRVRRSSTQMVNDPYTLVVALDSKNQAKGDLYIDDGHSFDYQQGAYVYRKFAFTNNKLTNTHSQPTVDPVLQAEMQEIIAAQPMPATHHMHKTASKVERVVLYGLENHQKLSGAYLTFASQEGTNPVAPHSAEMSVRIKLDFEIEKYAVVVRKPDAPIQSDWTIEFEF